MFKQTKKFLASFISTCLLMSTFLPNVVQANTLTTTNKDLSENTAQLNHTDEDELIISNELQLTLKNKENGVIETITIPFTQDSDYNQIIESFNTSNYNVENFNINNVDTYIQPRIVGTLFDIGCLIISISEFNSNPSLWNAIGVVFDAGAVVLPGVPAVNGALSAIKGSSKLQDSLTWANRTVKKAGITRYSSMPTRSGYQKHHIIEKRLKAAFPGATDSNMFSILIKTEDHYKITAAAKKYLPYNTIYTKSQVRNGMRQAYQELYNQTGDPLYLFLREFSWVASPY